mmetsp:Transcript_92114/g.231629  ORF Transcript_92114/g.231629 Transcript_92114/m.231629 type:complete len:210 (+) Transcript_92114:790-1419(+)
MFLAMPALMPKRSARVMPGLRGRPAGTSTRSHPDKHSESFSIGLSSLSSEYAFTLLGRSKCDKSAATPSAGTIAIFRSKMQSSPTRSSRAMSMERGWPMPPAPPQTQTLNFLLLLVAFGASSSSAPNLGCTMFFTIAATSVLWLLGSVKKSGGALPKNMDFKNEGKEVGLQRHQYDDFGGSMKSAKTQPTVTPPKANKRSETHCCLNSP